MRGLKMRPKVGSQAGKDLVDWIDLIDDADIGSSSDPKEMPEWISWPGCCSAEPVLRTGEKQSEFVSGGEPII